MQHIAKRIRALQIVFDLILVSSAWAISYWLRFSAISGGQSGLASIFLVWSIPLVLLTLHFLLKNGHYDGDRLRSVTDDVMRIFRANALSLVTFIVLLYFVADIRISRITLIFYALTSTGLLIVGRFLFRSIIRKMRRRGFLLRKVYVAGDNSQIAKYLQTIEYTPGTGLQIAGLFGARRNPLLAQISRYAHFELSEFETKLREESPDLVVLGFDGGAEFVSRFISEHFDELFQIQVLVPENEALLGLSAEMIEDVHVLGLNQPRYSAPEIFAKRMIDFTGAGVGLLVLSPLLGLLALAVRISSPGPIFFSQERVGLEGQRFKMWKFRTMKVATSEEEARGWTVENDPRRTKIGTLLRSTSLDELPQLWNVFVGDMSLVGPRPEQTHFVDKFRREIPAYMLRHKMKAGITGWAQVNGWRGDTSLHKRIEFDLFYIRNWTLWFDVKILLMTFVKGFINKNAY